MTEALGRSFASLSIPNFRRYFTGQLVSLSGNWMQMIADCIQNLSNCSAVQTSLTSVLPAPAGTALGTAIQNALTAADSTEKLVSSTLMGTLNTLNTQTGLLGFCFAFGFTASERECESGCE